MGRYAFGPFEFDGDQGSLRKHGIPIRIQKQPLQILRTLVERNDQVVSREDLRQTVWGDDTFVDFEHGLNAAVNKIRQALGDSSDRAQYIETLPGQGYRFIAPVEALSDPGTAPEIGSISPRPPQADREPAGAPFGPGSRWWIAVALMLLVTIWETARFRQRPSEERVLSLQINPPDGSEFAIGTQAAGMSLSPDGKTAAYVATAGGKAALWVRSLDGTSARLLAGTEDAGMPFWSPDGKSVAFVANGKLQRVYLEGGTPQTICQINARGGTWSDDGRILIGGWSSGLYEVDASGGTALPFTILNASRGELFHYWPQFLPGGKFLYFVRSNKGENTGVYAASFNKPREAVQLLATETNALYAPAPDGGANNQKGYLLWLRGGTLVAQDFDASTLVSCPRSK